ncbi:hypothetical protein GPALN_004617 [Globodera pallida]|nr:hypothetical protein GPALN_004617 [Globodera pallida]
MVRFHRLSPILPSNSVYSLRVLTRPPYTTGNPLPPSKFRVLATRARPPPCTPGKPSSPLHIPCTRYACSPARLIPLATLFPPPNSVDSQRSSRTRPPASYT